MASARHAAVAAWLGLPAEVLIDLRDEVLEAIVARMQGGEATLELRGRLAEAVETYRVQALSDPLTGLPNRRALDQVLAARSRRREPLTAVVIEIRDLARINQDHGLAAGDAVIEDVAARVRAATSLGDLVARASGTVLAVISSEMDETAAAALVDQLSRSGSEPVQLEGASIPVRLGIAWTAAVEATDSWDALRRMPLSRG
ncbi:MAG: GGDEF domain-containing protein [Chloroflexi bacterium]|nr:MAG: GGDEF domain-containing protein [Chloroflexota bacterium]